MPNREQSRTFRLTADLDRALEDSSRFWGRRPSEELRHAVLGHLLASAEEQVRRHGPQVLLEPGDTTTDADALERELRERIERYRVEAFPPERHRVALPEYN